MPASKRTPTADAGLAERGEMLIGWADAQMPVLRSLRERLADERPLEGVAISACLHVTPETGALVRALVAGGARVALCAANPLSTRDEVTAALAGEHVVVHAKRGADLRAWSRHLDSVAREPATIVLDDCAELITRMVDAGAAGELRAGIEETTTGVIRLRALAAEDGLPCPVLAAGESPVQHLYEGRHGAGQSVLDGIMRATNVLLAGRRVVVVGYGAIGQGVALRARGLGAGVIVCELDPVRALAARMEGFDVMPSVEAAAHADVVVTATGAEAVVGHAHFERLRDGAILCNAGHFDVEIDLAELRDAADGPPRPVRPLVEEYRLGGRRIALLGGGHVINLVAGEGHSPAVMDVAFATQALLVEWLIRERPALGVAVHDVPPEIDARVAALALAALGIEIDA